MTSQPNILFITSDQHRADSLGSAGHPCVRTPHLDQLANEGTRFTRAYTDCPVCIPARTTMISGVKSSTYGCSSYHAEYRIDRKHQDFLGSLMTNAGYQTCLVGKRHWHTESSYRAGFESVIPIERCKRAQNLAATRDGGISGMGANELHTSLSRVPVELYSTDWVVDRGMEFLREREQASPFFLWLSMIDPHPPLVIHEPYYSMYDHSPIPEALHGNWTAEQDTPLPLLRHRLNYNSKPIGKDELRKTRGVYYGMISNIDEQLGRVFGYLKTHGLWENTLVVYTSDHGEMLGDHDDAAKSSFLNAAANIPMIVHPPASWEAAPGQVSDALVELADLLPTFCETATIAAPEDVDGRSIKAVVTDSDAELRDTFFGTIDRQYCIMDAAYKYLYFPEDGSELLFATEDKNDLNNLLPNDELAQPYREKLIAKLTELKIDDVIEGKLKNDNASRPSIAALKAADPSGLGHAGRSLNFGRNV